MYKRETEMTWDPSIGQSRDKVLGDWKVSGKPDTDFRAGASIERLGRIQSSSRRKKDFDKSGSVSGVVGS